MTQRSCGGQSWGCTSAGEQQRRRRRLAEQDSSEKPYVVEDINVLMDHLGKRNTEEVNISLARSSLTAVRAMPTRK